MAVVIYVYANIGISALGHIRLPEPIDTFANFRSTQVTTSIATMSS